MLFSHDTVSYFVQATWIPELACLVAISVPKPEWLLFGIKPVVGCSVVCLATNFSGGWKLEVRGARHAVMCYRTGMLGLVQCIDADIEEHYEAQIQQLRKQYRNRFLASATALLLFAPACCT